ncbi:hypothetical protein P7C71_g4431, partial [Lecanoromycetidae sp. Uapishka_2]
MYYFQENDPGYCATGQASNATLSSNDKLEVRAHSLIADDGIAVVDGHTFTSPSVYLEILGTATAADNCGQVGPTLTNAIVTFAPGELSTWVPPNHLNNGPYNNFALGATYTDPEINFMGGVVGTNAALDVRDLACPTWGLGKSTSADGNVVTTIGSPFLPLIVPGTQFFTLDPMWASLCTALRGPNGKDMQTFALFDPPQLLIPQSRMLADPAATPVPATTQAGPTTVDVQVTPLAGPAKPAPRPVDVQAPPASTGDPAGGITTSSHDTDPKNPHIPASATLDPTASQTQENGSPSDSQHLSPGTLADLTTVAGYQPEEQSVPSFGSFSPSPDNSQDPPNDPQESWAVTQGEKDPQQGPNLGGMIYSALGKVEPEAGDSSKNLDTTAGPKPVLQETDVAGSPVLTFDPSKADFEWLIPTAGGLIPAPSEGVSPPLNQPEPNDNAANDSPSNVAEASSNIPLTGLPSTTLPAQSIFTHDHGGWRSDNTKSLGLLDCRNYYFSRRTRRRDRWDRHQPPVLRNPDRRIEHNRSSSSSNTGDRHRWF